MLYGRLPTTRRSGPSEPKSNSSASALYRIRRSAGCSAAIRAARSRSISITVSRLTRSSNGSVSAPTPGRVWDTLSRGRGAGACDPDHGRPRDALEQRTRKRAQAGPDLDHVVVRPGVERGDDALDVMA